MIMASDSSEQFAWEKCVVCQLMTNEKLQCPANSKILVLGTRLLPNVYEATTPSSLSLISKAALGWGRYQDVNPLPTSPLADDITTAP